LVRRKSAEPGIGVLVYVGVGVIADAFSDCPGANQAHARIALSADAMRQAAIRRIGPDLPGGERR
jgi:hypothetical protein